MGCADGCPAGPGPFGAAPAAPRLAGGIEAIHLDGKVQATLDRARCRGSAPPRRGQRDSPATGVTVAVLDTGSTTRTPTSPAGCCRVDASYPAGVTYDPHGHGTHVASTSPGPARRATVEPRRRRRREPAGRQGAREAGSAQVSWIIEAMEWAGQRAPRSSDEPRLVRASDGEDLLAESLDAVAEQPARSSSSRPATRAHRGHRHPGVRGKRPHRRIRRRPQRCLSYFSSQGPLARSGALKPDLAGPGSDITAARSADSAGDGAYIGHERHLHGDAARGRRRRDPQAAASRVHRSPAARGADEHGT